MTSLPPPLAPPKTDDPRLLSRAHLLAIRDQVHADEDSMVLDMTSCAKQLVEHALLIEARHTQEQSTLAFQLNQLNSSLASSQLDRERQQVDYEILERQARVLARKVQLSEAGEGARGGDKKTKILKSDVKYLSRRLEDSTTQIHHLTTELLRLRSHALHNIPSLSYSPSFSSGAAPKSRTTMGDAAAEHLLLASRAGLSSVERIERVPLRKDLWQKSEEIRELGSTMMVEEDGVWEVWEKEREERRIWREEKEEWERERGRAGPLLPFTTSSGSDRPRDKGKGKQRALVLDILPPAKKPRTSSLTINIDQEDIDLPAPFSSAPRYIDPLSTTSNPNRALGRPTSALDVLAQASTSFSQSQESGEMMLFESEMEMELEATDVEEEEDEEVEEQVPSSVVDQFSSEDEVDAMDREQGQDTEEPPATDADLPIPFHRPRSEQGNSRRASSRPATARASRAVQEKMLESDGDEEEERLGWKGGALKEGKEGEWTSVRQPYLKWTTPEDEQLCEAVIKHGLRWDQVANEIPTRTYHQCRQRFLRGLKSGASIPRPLSHLTTQVREKVKEHERRKKERRAAGGGSGARRKNGKVQEEESESGEEM